MRSIFVAYSLTPPFPSDYNTRFSGIRPEHLERATHDLAGIRERLHALMDADSILVGHALENDLKTLRIIHHRCVDTALLFPHGSGAPYRKALRDLCVLFLDIYICFTLRYAVTKY